MISFRELKALSRTNRVRNRMIELSSQGNVLCQILMFHYVTDQSVDTLPVCLCTLDNFTRTLDNYKAEGYEFVSVEKALENINNDIIGRYVVVTFDDIPDCVYTNAYPILNKRNIPFAIFVASGKIDTSDFITRKHLVELSKNPLCTVGAHTVTHTNLSMSDNVEWEINHSKLELEEVINKTVKYFAYPFGTIDDVPQSAIDSVEKNGFEAAFGTVSAPICKRTLEKYPWFLPRVVSEQGQIVLFSKRYIWQFLSIRIKNKLKRIFK